MRAKITRKCAYTCITIWNSKLSNVIFYQVKVNGITNYTNLKANFMWQPRKLWRKSIRLKSVRKWSAKNTVINFMNRLINFTLIISLLLLFLDNIILQMTPKKLSESLHQLLVLVIDINPHQLLFARQPGSFSQVLNSVMTLLSQHMMLHPTNQVKYYFC